MAFEVIHLGGEHCVTGSCHLVQTNGLNLLIDCGAVQGEDQALPMHAWPVAPSQIDFLFVTHAHIDHIGRIPELIQKGFKGEILTTHPTRELLIPMLQDAMALSHLEGKEAISLLETVDQLSWGFEYGQTFDLKKGIRFALYQAGHILGSACLYLESGGDRDSLLFSGDLGRKNTPLVPDPDPPPSCDLLILESTYGDRLHEINSRRIKTLGKVLTQALSDAGKVLIPAFAMGRTQELLYDLDRLFTDSSLKKEFPKLNEYRGIPVVLDSPLSLELTKVTSKLSHYWDHEAKTLLEYGDHPMDFEHLYVTANHRDHLKLLEHPGPLVVIAGSGMCTGGRIVDHLKAGIEDPKNDIIFIGYNARGTTGRAIQEAATQKRSQITLGGRNYQLQAEVHTLESYSAHADQRELVEWVKLMPEKPRKIKLVHGETSAQTALAKELMRQGFEVEA